MVLFKGILAADFADRPLSLPNTHYCILIIRRRRILEGKRPGVEVDASFGYKILELAKLAGVGWPYKNLGSAINVPLLPCMEHHSVII